MKRGERTTQRPAARAAAPRRAPPARPARRALPVANHVRLALGDRSDAREVEADRAAERVLAGESGVARSLAPAPAAAGRVPQSPGRPLPWALREELEEGFGADLDAVRLHSGAAAAAAARRHRAAAFTAGRDVYLGAGAPGPASEEGLALLAHEVAHVLQQTGRRGAGGRLVATAAAGAGEVQRAGLDAATYRKDRAIDFAAVLAEHGTAADPELAKLADEIGKLLTPAGAAAPDLAYDAGAAALEAKVGGWLRKPRAQRELLYDVLKLADRPAGALRLLAADRELQTRYWMQSMGAWLSQQAPVDPVAFDLWNATVAADKDLKALRHLLVDTFRQLIFGPYRVLQSVVVTGVGSIDDVGKKLHEAGVNGTGPRTAEHLYGAAYVLAILDFDRLPSLAALRDNLKRWTAPGASRSWQIAISLKKIAAELEDGPNLVFRWLGGELAPIAELGVETWQKAFAVGVGVDGDPSLTFEVPDDPEAFKGVFPRHADFLEKVPKALNDSADRLLKLGSGDVLPARGIYAAQRDSARASVRGLAVDVLQTGLLAESRKGAPDYGLLLAYAWFLAWSERVIQELDLYVAADDEAFEKEHGTNDVRFAHRRRFALSLLSWARFFAERGLKGGKKDKAKTTAWERLIAALEKVETHTGQGASQVALLSEWEKDPETDDRNMVAKMSGDFPGGIEGLGTLPVADVALLYKTFYYSDLAERIRTMLADAEQRGDPRDPQQAFEYLKEEPILKRALEGASVESRPQRLKVLDYEVAITAEDKKKPADPFDAVMGRVVDHPKSNALETKEAAIPPSGRIVIYPHLFKGEIVAWGLPPLWQVVELLRTSPAIIALDAAIGAAAGVEPDKVIDLGWEQFVEALGKIDAATMQAAVRKAATEERDKAGKELTLQLKAVTTFERRLLATRIKVVLGGYDRRASTYEIPNKVLEAIENFGRWVSPPEDGFLQSTALILAVAPTMRSAFGPGDGLFSLGTEERFDVITGYLPPLLTARRWANDKGLDRLMDDKERSERAGQLADLKVLVEAFKAERRKQQARYGFGGRASAQELYSLSFSSPVKAGEKADPFVIDGNEYKVLTVYQDFKFNPQYGLDRSLVHEDPDATAKSELVINGTPIEFPKRTKAQKLFRLQINGGEPFDVTAADDLDLHEYKRIIDTRAHVLGLEATLAVMEGAATLVLEAAEFIPGAGQAIMAARIGVNLIQFLTSDEFDAIVGLLSGDVTALVDRLKETVSNALSPEGLAMFLLFGSDLADRLEALAGDSGRERRVRPGNKKKGLGRIFHRVKNLGRGLGLAVKKLEQNVERPVQATQSFVVVRPRLALALTWTANNIYKLSGTPSIPDLAEIRAQVTESKDAFAAQVRGIFEALGSLELPDEILPLDLAAKHLVSMLLDRMGAKVRAVKWVIWSALDAAGTLDFIFGEVGDAIRGSAADPNEYWREHVKGHVETLLNESVPKVITPLFDTLKSAGLGDFVPPAPPALTVGSAGDFDDPEMALPELERYAEGAPAAAGFDAAPLTSPGPGSPLPARARASAEARFGHDFGHVRVHAGAAAGGLTRGLGARALTSGSHVFLGSAGDLAGARSPVLDHELAHVLQQGGPRPLDRDHDPRPRPGRAGRGLVLDPGRERAAERAAARAGSGVARAPLAVGAQADDGAQPLPLPTLQKILRRLSSVEEVTSLVAELEKVGVTERGRVTAQRAGYAEAIWKAVFDHVAALPATRFAGAVRVASADIKDHFTGTIKSRFADGTLLKDLAAGATVEKTDPTAAGAGAGKPKPKTYLFKAGRFARFLEAALLGEGVSVQFDLDNAQADKMEKGEAIDETKVVDGVKIGGLYLPAVNGNATLWTNLWSATKAAHPSIADDLREKIRERLRPYGAVDRIPGTSKDGDPISIPIFDTGPAVTALRFSAELIDYMGRAVLLAADVDDVGPVTAYTFHGGADMLGLRVGTFGAHKNHPGRESHHTTQYLLIEYFVGKTSPKPFQGGRTYPGLLGTAGKPRGIKAGGGEIDFSRFDDSGRGKKMPAVLLAKETHRNGDLHVTPQTQDDTIPSTQGGKVHTEFTSRLDTALDAGGRGLKTDYRAAEKGSDADFDAYAGAHAADLAACLYEAALSTYRWMRSEIMMPALEKALPGVERPYYRSIALKKHHVAGNDTVLEAGWNMQPDDLKGVYKAAESKNDEVMGGAGWTAS